MNYIQKDIWLYHIFPLLSEHEKLIFRSTCKYINDLWSIDNGLTLQSRHISGQKCKWMGPIKMWWFNGFEYTRSLENLPNELLGIETLIYYYPYYIADVSVFKHLTKMNICANRDIVKTIPTTVTDLTLSNFLPLDYSCSYYVELDHNPYLFTRLVIDNISSRNLVVQFLVPSLRSLTIGTYVVAVYDKLYTLTNLVHLSYLSGTYPKQPTPLPR